MKRISRFAVAAPVGVIVFLIALSVFRFAYLPPLFDVVLLDSRAEVAAAADRSFGPRWPGSTLSVSDQRDGDLTVERRWIFWEARMEAEAQGTSWRMDLGVRELGPARDLQEGLAILAPAALAFWIVFRGLRPPPEDPFRRARRMHGQEAPRGILETERKSRSVSMWFR